MEFPVGAAEFRHYSQVKGWEVRAYHLIAFLEKLSGLKNDGTPWAHGIEVFQTKQDMFIVIARTTPFGKHCEEQLLKYLV